MPGFKLYDRLLAQDIERVPHSHLDVGHLPFLGENKRKIRNVNTVPAHSPDSRPVRTRIDGEDRSVLS